jgi:Bifunctional DNA primase/polymerase, N-terminal.
MTAAPITRPDPLDTALRYLGLGFSVIPVKARDKRPALASWKEYQTRIATEAALRWAWGTNYDTHDCDEMVNRGVKALLGEDA